MGDYVELGDKKGQVLRIGIRSSMLLTDDGARVLIPNGDFISGRLVNWTFSESDIRVNLHLTVVPKEDMGIRLIKDLLHKRLSTYEEVDLKIPIHIYTKEIAAGHYVLSLQVGVRHVRLIERFRGRFLEDLKKEMDALQIQVTSS